MAKQKVYVVVHRDLVYNDSWYEWSGGEQPIRAFRSRERAEALAAELTQAHDPNVAHWGKPHREVGPSHVVMEALIDVPDEEDGGT